jgi:Domain of unknown function (DUF1905)
MVISMPVQYTFSAPVWVYPGASRWHFVTLPQDVTDDIRSLFQGVARGWGSYPVDVTLGSTRWQTSIFPDKGSSSFVLPLKAEVRRKEQIGKGDTVSVRLDLDP